MILISLIDFKHALNSKYDVKVSLSCPKTVQHDHYVPKWYPDPPMPYIDSIDEEGLVLIKFNSTMVPQYAISQDKFENETTRRHLEQEFVLGTAANLTDDDYKLIHQSIVRINDTDLQSLEV